MSKRQRKNILGWTLGLGISLICLVGLVRSVDIVETFRIIRHAHVNYVLAAVCLTLCSYLLRSLRWQMFFAEPVLNFSDSFRCLIVGFFMNNVLPARLGEFVRAHLGGKATGLSRALVIATIAGERLADGLAISAFFAVFFTFGAKPQEIEQGHLLYQVAYFFAGAASLTALILAFRKYILSLVPWIERRLPSKTIAYALEKGVRFIEGLEPMFALSRLLRIAFFSILIWSLELVVYYCVAQAFGQDLSLGSLSLFLAATNFSSLVPAAPGGVGVIELFATFALVQVGLDKEVALSMVSTQHIIQICVVGIPGLLFFILKMRGHIPKAVIRV